MLEYGACKMNNTTGVTSGKNNQNGDAGSLESIDSEKRTRKFNGIVSSVVAMGTLFSVLMVCNKIFNLKLVPTVYESQYLYLLAGIFLSITFLIFPASSSKSQASLKWYDVVLSFLTMATSLYFAWNAEKSLAQGWEYAAPDLATGLSFVFYLLILEGTRRTGGWVIFAVVLLMSLYPVVADQIPGPISGFSRPLPETIVFHLISSESAFGIPMKAFGQIVIGFIVFGAALQSTGGGKFFNDLALLLVGRYRGGAAKVSIFASGFMGSMSGSVISNVLTTGTVSIPAMKRTGFSPRYAAGTEACASTGGVLMPPVMGSTAFVMASFIGMPYSEIIIAAAIPSMLFYFGLFVQIDAYAGRQNLKGLNRTEVPRAKEIFANGWQFLLVFAVLIFVMMVLRRETQAPFFATLLLLVINQISSKTRLSIRGFVELIASIGKALGELVTILLGVGMIVGAFNATGLAGTIVNDLIFLGGGEVVPLLFMGAMTAFIFGMGMTVTACYIFLAIVLAPALTSLGLNLVAIHLFILYWGMVSFITPPVALGAFAAATLAGTGPMSAGLAAMRLGSVIYIVPFLFVLDPALVAQASLDKVLLSLLCAVVGVFFIGASLQGYISKIGAMRPGVWGISARVVLFASGLVLAISGGEVFSFSREILVIAGFSLASLPLFDAWKYSKQSASAAA